MGYSGCYIRLSTFKGHQNQAPRTLEAIGNRDCGWLFETPQEEFEKIPTGALGLYTYYERLAQGLRQLMCGSRKFSLEHIARDDLACLTHEAADISGIPFITDVDKAEVEEILAG